MTETTQTVFDRYEVRKTKKQKAAFRAYAASVAQAEGYECHEEKGSFGAKNLVVGDPETARVIYTAHYDTCARLPFPNFITPTNIWIYLLYQLVITAFLLGGALVVAAVATLILVQTPLPEATVYSIVRGVLYIALFFLCWVILSGPANRHTANDNTSGVTTLLDLMHAMPDDLRGEVAFIFFDLEEAGMLGSAGYYGAHKKAMQQKLLINFDCVSDGATLLFAAPKRAAAYAPALQAAFPATDELDVQVKTKGVFYPSDQAAFPIGVAVAALKKTKGGLLYMNRIHTVHDTVYEEKNIAYLVEGSVRLVRDLTKAEP